MNEHQALKAFTSSHKIILIKLCRYDRVEPSNETPASIIMTKTLEATNLRTPAWEAKVCRLPPDV